MAKLPDLYVNAVTTFDGKALSKGEKQIKGFEKNVKSLAKAFGVAFSVTALAQYSKNAVRAFASQQLEVAQLTTAVRNLGLAFATPEIDQFIDKLEAATGVNRDQLQPAMLKLLQVTGSVTKSQELLNLAMDVSAGTGADLASTSEKLSQAYVGNFKGLRSLNLGLTQAELASSDFETVQKRLQVLFAGQAKVAADSYVGSMNKLAIASENASEKIGKSLLDALTALSGGKTIDDTISKIDTLSSAIAGLIDATVGLKAGEILQQYYGLKEGKIPGGFGNRSLSASNQDTQKADAKARAKAEADAAKRAKELLALQKKAALVEKNKLSLSKAAAVFDTQRISIAAALRSTYDKETILRLEALQAIEEDNGDLALRKIGELAAFQKNADLQKLAGIKQIGEATLNELNTRLLTELDVINKSKMAEGDKELAREEAFKKYNAAIEAAGQLAAKEQYSERTQIQLTEIARLASQSNTTNALKTQVLLREQAELSMIDRVASAQKKADEARLSALQTYINLLNKAGTGPSANTATIEKMSPAQAEAALAKEPTSVPTALTPAQISGLRYAAQGQDAYEKSLAKISLTDQVAQGSFTQGREAGLSVAAAASGARYAAQAAASYTLNFSAGVIAQPDEFAVLIQDTIQKLNRGGDPLTTAGVL